MDWNRRPRLVPHTRPGILFSERRFSMLPYGGNPDGISVRVSDGFPIRAPVRASVEVPSGFPSGSREGDWKAPVPYATVVSLHFSRREHARVAFSSESMCPRARNVRFQVPVSLIYWILGTAGGDDGDSGNVIFRTATRRTRAVGNARGRERWKRISEFASRQRVDFRKAQVATEG